MTATDRILAWLGAACGLVGVSAALLCSIAFSAAALGRAGLLTIATLLLASAFCLFLFRGRHMTGNEFAGLLRLEARSRYRIRVLARSVQITVVVVLVLMLIVASVWSWRPGGQMGYYVLLAVLFALSVESLALALVGFPLGPEKELGGQPST